MPRVITKQIRKYQAKKSQIKHICIVCDAIETKRRKTKKPLISGVQTHTTNITNQLVKKGYKVTLLHPHTEVNNKSIFKIVNPPMDTRFNLVLNPFIPTSKFLRQLKPDAIFISTPEGPIGLAALLTCVTSGRYTKHKKIPYTASYHTNLDIYLSHKIKEITGGLLEFGQDLLHPLTFLIYKNAKIVLVPTKTMRKKVKQIGIINTTVWPRGVDSEKFRLLENNEKSAYEKYEWFKNKNENILIYFGRVSIEKNLEDFLDMKTPDMHKVVIGDGPYLENLKEKYKSAQNIHFLGAMFDEDLAHHVRSANLLVFPSKFDTFGNVITEAGASGVPTLAYKVQGPKDVIQNGKTGVLIPENKPLISGLENALQINRKECREITISKFSWEKSANILLNNLYKITWK